MKKRFFLLALLALFAFSFAACTEETTAGTTTAAPKDDLVIIGMLTAESLNPFDLGSSDKVVNFQIFDSLVRYGSDGTIEAGLAESWNLEDDGLTLTFTLRSGVEFHDGTALTADDVIFSLDMLFQQPMNSWMRQYVASWTKVDESTIQVVKVTPFAKVLNILADRLYVSPKAAATLETIDAGLDTESEQWVFGEAFLSNPFGTGVYKFVSQSEDKSITLVANADYYRGEAAITNVIVTAPVDASAAVIKLETGEADIIFGVPAAQKAIITGNEDLEYEEAAGWGMHTLLLMGDDFDDLNLRKAISYAVNPENAILVANEGIGSVPENLFSEKTMGDLAGEVAINGYNATEAANYFALSDYVSTMELVITVDASTAAIAQSIQSDLSAIGITVTIDQLDINALYGKLMNGELDMTIMLMGTHMNGVEEMLAFPTMPPFSFGMSPSAARVSLIQQAQAEIDPATRANLCKQALQYAVDEADIVPVFEPVFNIAYTNELTDIEPIWAATNIFYLGEVKPA